MPYSGKPERTLKMNEKQRMMQQLEDKLKSLTLDNHKKHDIYSENIFQAVEFALQENNGLLFFHHHSHLGSYRALIHLMPILQRSNVKTIFLEQPISIFDNILAHINKTKSSTILQQGMKASSRAEKEFIDIFLAFINAAIAHDIKLIPIAPDFSIHGILEILTDRETKLLTNISKELSHHHGKFIGLLGGWHVSMAHLLNLPSCYLKPSIVSSGAWEIKHATATSEDFHDKLVLDSIDNSAIRNNVENIFTILPKFVDMAFEMPQRANPNDLIQWQTNRLSSQCNHYCFFAALGLSAALLFGTAVTYYTKYSTPNH
jgi:hypothetical protein